MIPVRRYCIRTHATIPIIPNLDHEIRSILPIASSCTLLLAQTKNGKDEQNGTRYIDDIRKGIKHRRSSHVMKSTIYVSHSGVMILLIISLITDILIKDCPIDHLRTSYFRSANPRLPPRFSTESVRKLLKNRERDGNHETKGGFESKGKILCRLITLFILSFPPLESMQQVWTYQTVDILREESHSH